MGTEDDDELDVGLTDWDDVVLARPKSYNEAVAAAGGTPISEMTHEEAKPIIAEMMRAFLKVPEGEDLVFNEEDFAAAVNAMPMEEYALKRRAIAAFRLNG